MRHTKIAETLLNRVPVDFVEPTSPCPENPSVDLSVGEQIVLQGLTLEDLGGLKQAISKAEAVLRYRRDLAIKAKNHCLDF